MHCEYTDIRSRIDGEPLWFDEHGVPRYAPFEPGDIANIYATECALMRVDCQACGRAFRVVISDSTSDRAMRAARDRRADMASLAERIRDDTVHYGDPPNVRCCPAGPTMNSVPRYVVAYWHRSKATNYDWKRNPKLERHLDVEWAKVPPQCPLVEQSIDGDILACTENEGHEPPCRHQGAPMQDTHLPVDPELFLK